MSHPALPEGIAHSKLDEVDDRDLSRWREEPEHACTRGSPLLVRRRASTTAPRLTVSSETLGFPHPRTWGP